MAAPPREIEEGYRGPTAIPPDRVSRATRDAARVDGRNFWRKVDDLFYSTLKHAETAFRINLVINGIIIAVGIALIASSILYSWARGLDVFSVAFATIGVADFVALFFLNPQERIHQNIGNLVQIQIAYRTYLSQLESISDYDWQQYTRGNRSLEDVQRTAAALGTVSGEAIRAIQRYIEGDEGTAPAKSPGP